MPRLTGPPLLRLQFDIPTLKYLSILHIHPTLPPSDFYLFPRLKEYLKEHRSEDDEAVVAAVQEFIGAKIE
ncbi:hypothetical protein EVAR_72392_1, partial [Eumeta japonica]